MATKKYIYESDALKAAKKTAASAGSLAALVGAAAGFAAVLFSPKYGKQLKSEIGSVAEAVKAQVAADAALQLNKAKVMSKAVYDAIVQEAMAEYNKSSRMAEKDLKVIEKDLDKRWKHILRVAKASQKNSSAK
ncbi:MAG: hypothetical protein A3A97_03135 [Candidatus Terrybacteria bacterium RIFCSPLOWO2_01_FULL_40_23]|uniref:Uncharacterized protein n=1 Tax=Candidatus Terrybacteria bacterium RIFCSPLOWO2_01_FULL_40_23 TaxID=1802366 RepID=A0A1G2PSH6_9BACT|nr:MAG: hypothetical protein A3A97_03135 [Candidatus Terrybacteria bacterium RIFCSPLOWO2_01_FULL_40_23]